jgi:hypothetical protein
VARGRDRVRESLVGLEPEEIDAEFFRMKWAGGKERERDVCNISISTPLEGGAGGGRILRPVGDRS